MGDNVHIFKSKTPPEKTIERAVKPLLKKLDPLKISFLVVIDGEGARRAHVHYVRSGACHALVRSYDKRAREVWCPPYRKHGVDESLVLDFFKWMAEHSMFSEICTLVPHGGKEYLRVDNSKGFACMYAALIVSRMFIERASDGGRFIAKAAKIMGPRGIDWPVLYILSQVVKVASNNKCMRETPNGHHCALNMFDLSRKGLKNWLKQPKVKYTERKQVWALCGLSPVPEEESVGHVLHACLRSQISEGGDLFGAAPKKHTLEGVLNALITKVEEEASHAD